jgi:pimeloyl-ACP methyl ester carboxylesterase
MLKEDYMTRVVFRFIQTFLNVYLKFLPDTFPYDKRRASFQIPSVGWSKNGWILEEVLSPQTGEMHRYYINRSRKKNAPVFLFLHGLFLDGRNFSNVDALIDDWTLIAYDFPEKSTLYRGNMMDFSLLLSDLLTCLKIEKVYLCGVSFGGGVSVHFSAMNPSKVQALVLVSTFVMNASSSDLTKSREMCRFIVNHSDGKLYWLLDRLFKRVFSGKKNPMQGVLDIVYLKKMEWYRQAINSIATFDGLETSQKIQCPVLVVHGTCDKAIPLSKAKGISRYIPQTEFKVVEHGTHAMMYLQGSTVSNIIKDFCKTLGNFNKS